MQDWLFYSLLFPVLFAVVNIIDDNFLRKVYRSAYFGAIISGFFGMLPLALSLFFPIQIASFQVILTGIFCGFLTCIYYYFYLKALGEENPSVVIALSNLTPVFALSIAFLFLGETLTSKHLLGFIIIIIASSILSLTKFSLKKTSISKGLLSVIIASFIYAVVGVLSKFVYNNVDFVSGYMYFAVGLGIGGLFLSIVPKGGRGFYKEFGKKFTKYIVVFFFIELLGISAEMLNNLAISTGPISLVKVVEGIQPIYVLLFAIVAYPLFPKYFREAKIDGKLKKFICMMLILVGLYLINQ